ncbi:unnamed protein product [Calypogeia fissa]
MNEGHYRGHARGALKRRTIRSKVTKGMAMESMRGGGGGDPKANRESIRKEPGRTPAAGRDPHQGSSRGTRAGPKAGRGPPAGPQPELQPSKPVDEEGLSSKIRRPNRHSPEVQ